MTSQRLIPVLIALGLTAACESSPPSGSTAATASASTKPATSTAPAASARPAAPPAQPTVEPIPAPPDVAAAPADAQKTESGLKSKVIQAGTGKEHPAAEDSVKVHYTGWTTDGKMFDSSVARGQPASFKVNKVIKGWTEGLQLMVAGEKRRLWIPAELAYPNARAGQPAGDLVFDVELLEFTPAPKPPPVPEDVAAAPKSAKKTKSGLSYRVLTPGTGKAHPKATDTVVVQYTGWTTDGKMFDSSVTRGQPAVFKLDGVIKGWTEGVQLMTIGERTRFWIPGDLAYGDKPARPGAPAGQLVFDIELVAIK
jgi:peptidylprolyl isomerase